MTFGSISSKKFAFFSPTLLSWSMIHRQIENADITRERVNVTFDPRDMLYSLLIRVSFVKAACAILESTSGFSPLSETIVPRHL